MQLLFKFCLADFCPVEIPLYDGHPVRRVLRGPIGRYQHLSSTVSNGQDVRYTGRSSSLTSVFPYDGNPVRRDFTVRWTFSRSKFRERPVCRPTVATDRMSVVRGLGWIFASPMAQPDVEAWTTHEASPSRRLHARCLASSLE